jgi:hypothetical protein
LRDVRWFETDVSGLPIGPVIKGQAVQEEVTGLKKSSSNSVEIKLFTFILLFLLLLLLHNVLTASKNFRNSLPSCSGLPFSHISILTLMPASTTLIPQDKFKTFAVLSLGLGSNSSASSRTL